MEDKKLINEIEELKRQIGTIPVQPTPKIIPYESEGLNELFTSLAKAQLEMEVAKTDATNPFFKSRYADLASIVKASRKHLAINGLSVLQRILPNGDGNVYLYTRLCHASGQWMESKMKIDPNKKDIQGIGSYITYLKRYNYAAICGVVSDDDDDGEDAMKQERSQSSVPQRYSEKISKAQLQVIGQELEGMEDVLENILKGYKIGKLSDILAKNYTSCMNQIRNIKRAKES